MRSTLNRYPRSPRRSHKDVASLPILAAARPPARRSLARVLVPRQLRPVIIRRIVLTVVLVFFAAVATGVIVGLDDAARSSLVAQPPTQGPVSVEPATTPPIPTSSTPTTPRLKAPTVQPKPRPARPRPSASARTPQPRPTTKPRPSTKPSSPPNAAPAPTRKPATPPKSTGHRRTVYLTFDDGPSAYTPQILQILQNTGSTATFFQLGVNTPGQAHIAAAIRAQGSNIGNHSYNHPDLTTLTTVQLRWQISHGPTSRCFRPPYGATNTTVRHAIHRAGAHQVLWDIDTLDWTKPGVTKLEKIGASKHVTAGSIILMHDGGGTRDQTVAALPKMIHHLQTRGLTVRALPECS